MNMQWIKIDRAENGFVTEECLDKILNSLPVCLSINFYGTDMYKVVTHWETEAINFVKCKSIYTHYLPIPKLEV